MAGDKTYAIDKTYAMIEGVCITSKPDTLFIIMLPDSMKTHRPLSMDDLIYFALTYECQIEKKKITLERCLELEKDALFIRDGVSWKYNAIRELNPHKSTEAYTDYVMYKLGMLARVES